MTGIDPATLSQYNTGKRQLGMRNARRIAEATGVSVLDLGGPEAETDDAGAALLDRQRELEADVHRLTLALRRLTDRVRVLERQVPPESGRGAGAGAR